MRLAVIAIVIGLVGCSSKNPLGHSCDDVKPLDHSTEKLEAVQFKRDVMPIFKQSCAFSTCHGAQNNPNGAYLGSSADDVYANLVNQKSPELPTMNRITPGDPTNSFLMRKMDGTQCAFESQCTDGSCQDAMPKGEDVLDEKTRDVMRRWISQGAQND